MAENVIAGDKLIDNRRRTADRIFFGSMLYTSAITLVWLFFVVTQYKGGFFFGHYNVDAQAISRVLAGLLFFSVLWGWIWYRLRRFLLRRLMGFSNDELRLTFSSRMRRPFDLSSLLANRSERRIRIIDMIGRRGRFATIGLAGFAYLYSRLSAHPEGHEGGLIRFRDDIELLAQTIARQRRDLCCVLIAPRRVQVEGCKPRLQRWDRMMRDLKTLHSLAVHRHEAGDSRLVTLRIPDVERPGAVRRAQPLLTADCVEVDLFGVDSDRAGGLRAVDKDGQPCSALQLPNRQHMAVEPPNVA